MASIAKAMDVVQGENHAYMGCLLPTLAVTLRQLREVKVKYLRFCEPLVDAMLEIMEKRIRNVFKELDCSFSPDVPPGLTGTARRHPGLQRGVDMESAVCRDGPQGTERRRGQHRQRQ